MAGTPMVADVAVPTSGIARPLAVLLALGSTAVAFVAASDHDGRAMLVAAVLATWAALAVFLAWRRGHELTWVWCAALAISGALALLDPAFVAAVPACGAAIVLSAPTGTVGGRRWWLLLVVVAIGGAAGVAIGSDDGQLGSTLIIESSALAAVACGVFLATYQRSGAAIRARMQWIGWGVVVAGATSLATFLVYELLEWPVIASEVAIAATLFVPLSIALSAVDAVVLRVDRLLARTIEAGGLVVMVCVIYLVVVLGFGNAPDTSERRVLGLSMVAAILAALLYAPARTRLTDFANRRVYGERQAPDEPIQTFGARMSRSIPLEELLLQLSESLKKSMQLVAAEVWTGTDGVFELASSVPFREATRLRLSPEEMVVVARARASGNAWIQVWLPDLPQHHAGRLLRVVPLAHAGELLGLIVCARAGDATPMTGEEDRVLTELARQVALALHNSRLDTALQASLDDLRVANEELRASRARIVAAADQSRRQIERNLHDGAQQHLVALAVKLGLAKQLLAAGPETLAPMLDELRADAQETLTQLRELAHGIYPPLLIDRGLSEALRAAANRAVLPTDVHAEVGRFTPEVEAAVYFCCLEAMQNAGKHAGEGSRVTITVTCCDGELCFEVADNGAGFEATSTAGRGHGFVNMADRVGAIGGSIVVDSAPGSGTRIKGRMPAIECGS